MNTILNKKHSKRSFFAVLCTFLLCISLTLPVLASAKVDLASIEVANKSEISGDVYDGAGLLSSDQITALSNKLAAIEQQYHKCYHQSGCGRQSLVFVQHSVQQ